MELKTVSSKAVSALSIVLDQFANDTIESLQKMEYLQSIQNDMKQATSADFMAMTFLIATMEARQEAREHGFGPATTIRVNIYEIDNGRINWDRVRNMFEARGYIVLDQTTPNGRRVMFTNIILGEPPVPSEADSWSKIERDDEIIQDDL